MTDHTQYDCNHKRNVHRNQHATVILLFVLSEWRLHQKLCGISSGQIESNERPRHSNQTRKIWLHQK